MVIMIPLMIISGIFGLIANGIVTNYIVEHPDHNPFSSRHHNRPLPPKEDTSWIECSASEIDWHGWDTPFLKNALEKIYEKMGSTKLKCHSLQEFIIKFNLVAKLYGFYPKDFKI